MSSILIANLCPWSSKIVRPMRISASRDEQASVIEIAACPRGSAPTTLLIKETYELYRRLSMDPMTRQTILPQETATDFLSHVSLMGPYMAEDCRPAIWQCSSLEGPTQEEIDYNTIVFRRYCDRIVEEADEWDRRRQNGEAHVPKHTQRQRDCANWMLYKREWLFDMTPNSLKQCEFCFVTIPAKAIICPTCSQVVDQSAYEAKKAQKKAQMEADRAAAKQQLATA
jgi:hypothetical protein